MDPLKRPTAMSDSDFGKRANKACCNCRRNKIKCGGERPCAACLRRGIANEKCVDGCFPCRRSRAECDGSSPCGRCKALVIQCLDQPAPPKHDTGNPPRRSSVSNRPDITVRAKAACLACRRDNKKCDDNRPCLRCALRSEECIHVERSPKAVKHRCVNCRKTNKKCEENRPCQNCIASNLECVNAPRKGSVRVKVACANCRQNKVQCDSERPCRTCVRRGLECTPPESCSCTETGSESGTCMSCRTQGTTCNSPMYSDAGNMGASKEEFQLARIKTPQSTSSSHTAFGKIADFPVAHQPQTQFQEANRLYQSSQECSSIVDIHTTGETFPGGHCYSTNYPIQQSTTSEQELFSEWALAENILQFPTTKHDNQEQCTGLANNITSDSTHQSLTINDHASADFENSTNPGTGILEQYLAQIVSTDTSAQSGGFSAQPGFIPQTLPMVAESTSGGMPGNYIYTNSVGVGIGMGAYGPHRTTFSDSLSQAYGPVPMPMPVAVTIPVPQQSAHTRRGIHAQITDQIGIHPQLRRSARYISSDSKETRHSA